MKSFSHFCLILLCSTGLMHAMNNEKNHYLQRDRSNLTQKIRSINLKITALEQNSKNNQKYRALHQQLLNLLKSKKETYINQECSAYKKCIAEIARIEKILKENPQDLTISVVAKNDFELARLEAAKLKALAEAQEKKALKNLEQIIKNKIQNLPQFFTQCDQENLIAQYNSETNSIKKQALEMLFKLKTAWLKAETKDITLLETIENASNQFIVDVYAQWLKEETDPAWLAPFSSVLNEYHQLSTAIAEVIKTVQKHPKKSIRYQTINQTQKERITLFKTYFELQKQLDKNSNTKTKVQLDETLGKLLNNLTVEHEKRAPGKSNATIITLQEKRKALKTEIQNERCVIL